VTEPFLISDEHLRALSATRQGRVSIAGYNYQAAYAVARLVAMAVRQPVLDLKDWPHQLRYDWGEDLDEACDDGAVIFTQCKRVATIGQPASLVEVLAGFSPKWLWVPESERDRLRFRLICSDPRFVAGDTLSDSLKAEVRNHFLTRLQKPAGQQSDRAVWMEDAAAVGHEALFEALWGRFECIYLPADVVDSEPAGPRLAAEKEALRVLLERGQIGSSGQKDVLGRLRRLIHDNLITFDPANESLPPLVIGSPRRLDRADVNAAIDPWRPATQRQPPFQLVDRTFLSEQRELEREQFVARQPDWRDVAHGHDEVIKFIERDQTTALEAAVLEKVVTRIGRAGKLPTLFVAGAPGDGKTTITRRVAARLVDAGRLLIADTGVGLHEPPGEPDEYVQAVERLQSFGRPLVLLLDDPLYAESPWLGVLRKLNRPGLQVGVLAASPQFLLDEHKAQLQRAGDLATFEMARTSQHERESLAALYGRPVPSKAEEDFLVVAMEAAAGVAFSEIIARLWLTLADGRDLSSARTLSDLPWQTRAYLFVCFFSRAYEACPEPLLLKLLEMTGGVPGTSDVRLELQRMRHFAGWRIFRIGQRPEANLEYQGAPITAAHAVIARQAWEQRPLPWYDVGGSVIEASVSVPTSIRDVSTLGVRLRSPSVARPTPDGRGDDFAARLVERWRNAPGVETRLVCELVTSLMILGGAELALPLRETLTHRAIPDSQGWLAASQLWFLHHHTEKQARFPPEVDIPSLIQSADFSLAARRASKFVQQFGNSELLLGAFIARLLEALDGNLSWKLDGTLFTYLLALAAPEQLSPRVSQILTWLETHPDNIGARAKFLSFLPLLPTEFSALRADVARQTAEWLARHGDDTHVRTQYLSFLQQLPHEFSGLRADAARQTAQWLSEHSDDTSVRTQYLIFLSMLRPAREWQQLASDALSAAAELTVRSGWPRQHQTFINSFPKLHQALLRSLKVRDSEAVRKALKISRDAAAEWCLKNPSAGAVYDLPLP
jgi:hypothetical protein